MNNPYQQIQTQFTKRLLIIDGMAVVFRGYYAIPKLTTHDGKNTNAVMGFFMIIMNLIQQLKPTHVVFCFDLSGGSNRKDEYEAYKANRTQAPDELYEQIAYIKEGIQALNIAILAQQGFEADDLIASLVKREEQNTDNQLNIIYTGDLDILQLANQKTQILTPHNQKIGKLFDEQAVLEKYGFSPAQIPDYKGLHGDSSDNLPGVKGVGPKTAIKLLQTYGSLENIYNNLHELSPKMQELFQTHKDIAFLCKKLATLESDLEIPNPTSDFEINKININDGLDYFHKFAMRRQLVQLKQLQKQFNIPETKDEAQLELF